MQVRERAEPCKNVTGEKRLELYDATTERRLRLLDLRQKNVHSQPANVAGRLFFSVRLRVYSVPVCLSPKVGHGDFSPIGFSVVSPPAPAAGFARRSGAITTIETWHPQN